MTNMIVELLKEISTAAVEEKAPVHILTGRVTGVSPLMITVEPKLKLREENLILTKNVMDYRTEISYDNGQIRQTATSASIDKDEEGNPYYLRFKDKTRHEVTIYNALKINETVLLIRMQRGQKFIVLERLVEA